MKMLELLEKYPNATNCIREWMFNKMIESLDDESVPEEFKKTLMLEAVTNERLAIIIDVQPRTLFDVFDENNVIVIIKYHDNFGFTWAVEEANEQPFYKTRKEAELFAIETAFEILENKLTLIELPSLEK